MEKVKVQFLVNTAYKGPRTEGDTMDVPKDFAERWSKNGIAKIIGDPTAENQEVAGEIEAEPEEEQVEPVVEAEEDQVDLSKMSAKELFALCQERGIEVEQKKSKEYYIEKLS